ncbi:hypothetical protein [Coleofasciculus sp. FACHB-1120]|uniref:hypothetical protein n=1 Tax=Coleofasciculus sp. FACHB-1120 TaxID=2692783 RepID=UPI001688993A|nr:hypothetical protein [Coleofasciculus sp. FACHB-1120]
MPTLIYLNTLSDEKILSFPAYIQTDNASDRKQFSKTQRSENVLETEVDAPAPPASFP